MIFKGVADPKTQSDLMNFKSFPSLLSQKKNHTRRSEPRMRTLIGSTYDTITLRVFRKLDLSRGRADQ